DRAPRRRPSGRIAIATAGLRLARGGRHLAARAARLTRARQHNAGVSYPPDPEELEATSAPALAEISPATTIGPVHLTVSDLDASLAYYRDAIGLGVLERG